jgi:ribonuclease E
MPNNKMLIDAAHPEETRVVVLRGDKVEEFDFEAADRQQLRGNIYLAKVTRVEPSLQAAFVDYGGNRHGFLAFSEIHPDYYQIPVADRQALLAEQAREDAREAAEDMAANGDAAEAPADEPEPAGDGEDNGDADAVENVGAEDALEEVPERHKAPRPRQRQYKIQEVIKRRQVMLVQVVKEERGTKGAALTTYLSLAGRYSVLMPNTARGGGISRKITSPADRKRLKEVAAELDVPEGMGVILRTAGANRTKSEVKRDFEYLLRLWENVRELTLRSTAPTLVYEEGSLIKRSIRDLYSREIDAILVAGEEGYREAKDFMRMLMPSHAKNVQPYRERVPIFSRYGVEAQLDSMFSPVVTLKSGGYVVLNQTEALVSIDVNSGRSTREHSIEDTALRTNLEAADEVARQLRLRDLAGLIVIDFIDMEEKRNNRAVERKLKDCLKADRARIQLGRISHFGLMEMSRQRIRTGVLESSSAPCPTCHGTGQVRSVSSVTLQILRALDDHLLRQASHHLIVRTRPEVALYILNQKRAHLAQLEARYGLTITVSDEAPTTGAPFVIERGESVTAAPVERAEAVALMDMAEEPTPEPEETEPQEEAERGRRGRRRGRRRANGEDRAEAAEESGAEADFDTEQEDERVAAEESEEAARKRRRRGRRGGRRRVREKDASPAREEAPAQMSEAEPPAETAEPAAEAVGEAEPAQPAEATDAAESIQAEETVEPKPARRPRRRRKAEPAAEEAQPAKLEDEPQAAVAETTETAEPEPQPVREPEPEPAAANSGEEREAEPVEAEPAKAEAGQERAEPARKPEPEESREEEERQPKRTGWWQRRSFF